MALMQLWQLIGGGECAEVFSHGGSKRQATSTIERREVDANVASLLLSGGSSIIILHLVALIVISECSILLSLL